jgi:RNA polymerase sigma factor (sigma-70 family)
VQAMIDPELRVTWADVYERHASELSRLAAFLVGRDQAHDLVADAVARAVMSPGWQEVRQPGAYLVRSIVNEAHRFRRTTTRRHGREERAMRLSAPLVGVSNDPDPQLRAALDELSPQQRAVVFLAYWADMTIPQIARWLEISEGSVRQHLARAKARLREVIPGE